MLLHLARARAKRKGLDYDIGKEDFPLGIPENCPVLGIRLVMGQGCHTDHSPTLDRIDSSRGYVRGNVRIISFRANTLKGNMTLREAKLIVRDLRTVMPKRVTGGDK